jgi:hypothetical protein
MATQYSIEIPQHSTQRTWRRHDGAIETALTGTATREMMSEWIADYEALGGGEIWIFDALFATAYEPSIVDAATRALARARERSNLKTVIVIVKNPLMRMGGSLLGMMLQNDIRFVASREAMTQLIADMRRG